MCITSSMSMLTLNRCSSAATRFTCPMESQPSTVSGDERSLTVSRSTPNTLDTTSSMVAIASFTGGLHRYPGGVLDPAGSRVESPGLDAVDVADELESMTAIEFRGRFVLRGRDELSDHPRNIVQASRLGDALQKHGLHGQPHHPAAQQHVVDAPGVALLAHDGGADKAVLAEAVC